VHFSSLIFCGLISETTCELDVLKDPAMLTRLNELNLLSEFDKSAILYGLDGLLRDDKARKAYVH
jgi:hypothetical protein